MVTHLLRIEEQKQKLADVVIVMQFCVGGDGGD